MPGFTPVVSASVTRAQLSLADLNLSDHTNFYVSGDIFGGTVTWRRTTVKSPYVESEFTTNRVRGIVEDKFGVNVIGTDQVTMANNIAVLIAAFSQDTFNLTVQLDSQPYTYACEASDYTMDWSIGRMHSLQTEIKFQLRRSPVPINGPI
jgi:hypothetical protein